MRGAILIPLGLLGVAVLAASAGGGENLPDDRPDGPDDHPPDPTRGETQELIRAMADALGLDAGWVMFLEASAMGESGLNPLVGHGHAAGAPDWIKLRVGEGEAEAAKKAYDRNRDRYYKDCPAPVERYTFGSGGLWGALPANALPAFKNTPEICMDPWAIFQVAPSLIMQLDYCRRLMRWSGFKEVPTWANLRVGMRAPSLMGQEDQLERQRSGKNKLGDRLEQLGYDRALADAAVTGLPSWNNVDALRTVEKL